MVRFVNPQATFWLWPITMPGSPENEKPPTSNGHASSTVEHFNCTWYQTEGRDAPRCGSFASRGIPVSVRAPETTQEFEPMPSPTSPTRTLAASMTLDVSSHSMVVEACWTSPSVSVGVNAAGSASVPSVGTVEIFGTITGFSSNG